MNSLLTGVKAKMYIFAHRRARGVLDGEYASIFRGRSLDFDDLRDYVPGDEVRDIDWKATARVGTPLIKRYVATRRQQVLFVADTGRNMAATSRGGQIKKDIAVMVMGVIGLLACRHADSVALIHGDSNATAALPAKGTESHVENVLRRMDAASEDSGRSELCTQLEYAATHIKARTLLVVVADELAPNERLAKVLRRLNAQHEILWVEIADAILAGPGAIHGSAGRSRGSLDKGATASAHLASGWAGTEVMATDVEGERQVLLLLANDPELARSYAQAAAERSQGLAELLRTQGIAMTCVGATEQVMTAVFALLERHRRAR